MIDKSCLTAAWIAEKKEKYKKADPSIMERVIFALYLLEQLKLSGLEFVFKGGTSLLLLLNDAKRFSIDIDIVLPSGMDKDTLEGHLAKITGTVFKSYKLDERRSYKAGIPKAHYRFIYDSVVENKEQEILLDILFEQTHYPVMHQKPIATEWVKQDEISATTTVNLPDINSITGDKLTAFAPNTTGVPYKAEKEREIIKQLFDVGNLFDAIDNLETLKTAFNEIAKVEIVYRNKQGTTPEVVLDDIIQTGLLLAKRDNQLNAEDSEKFKELSTGISQFNYFLYTGSFRIEDAQTASAKAAYMAAMIKTGDKGPIKRFDSETLLQSYLIEHPDYNYLNKKLRHVPGGALFYWNETVKLLFQS